MQLCAITASAVRMTSIKKSIGRPWPPKLDLLKAREMRALRASGVRLREIAQLFGCVESTVSKIVKHDLWKEEE